MDGKQHRSGPHGAEYYRQAEDEPATTGPAGTPPPTGVPRPADDLLDEVVRQTVWSREDLGRWNQAEKEALVVAARHLHQSQADPETIAQELTRTLLAVRFPQLTEAGVKLDEVARQIAAELIDSPVAAERLQRLWQHLLQVPTE
jgi:hypothetical protein